MAVTVHTSKSRCAYERYKSSRSDCQKVSERDMMSITITYLTIRTMLTIQPGAFWRRVWSSEFRLLGFGLTLPKS